jgi:uncharacterized protein YcbK (DUF882 family)
MALFRWPVRPAVVVLGLQLASSPAAAPAASSAALPKSLSASLETLGLGRSGHVKVLLAMPGEVVHLPLNVSGTLPPAAEFRWVATGSDREPVAFVPGPDLTTTAPDPGIWHLEISVPGDVQAFDTFHLLVKVPAAQSSNGRLQNYFVGRYPNGKGRYSPPQGFVEVTEANHDIWISRSLRLSSFLTHDQQTVWPKYVLVDDRLIDKLELMVDQLRAIRPSASRLTIMSGFRSPQYNAKGLNAGRAVLSRHQYGDAADVWIDDDRDGRMDDLDGNGKHNVADASYLARIVEKVESRYPELVGGISAYPATSAHGPFVHVDARGVRARW